MSALLALDTSFNTTGAALLLDGRVVASASSRKERGHAENLIELVGAVLRDAGVEKSQLGAIGVTTGPGSFTGLRVGIAFAKGLATGLKLPMAGVSSLAALASPHSRPGTVTAVAVDAKKAQLYGAAYDEEGGELLPPGAYMPGEFGDALARFGLPVQLVGNGVQAYGAALTAPLAAGYSVTEPASWELDPCVVALLAGREIEEGRALAPAALLPVYLRRSEAEEKFHPNP